MALFFEIYWVFLKISLIAVGGVFGVLPELERMVVDQRGWVTHDQFIQSYVIAQFAPGPNMAMCPLIGYWVAGWPGWLAGFLGIYTGPIFIVLAGYGLYRRYRQNQSVRRMELALRPLVVGTMSAAALHLWWAQTDDRRWLALVLTAITGALFARKILSPLLLIFAMGFLWWGSFRLF